MSKSKMILKWLLSVFALLAAISISLVLYKVTVKSPPFLTASSSGGLYTVELVGEKDMPLIPIFTHEVHANVLKNGKPFLSDKLIHSGGWLDPSFEILYPDYRWVDNNILNFYREEYFSKGIPDTIVVINSTDKVINYLRVTSTDMFLLFDVRPREEVALTISPPRGSPRWVSIEGEFSNGQNIKLNGKDFIIRKEQPGPFTYHIYIKDNDSVIESPQLEKYKSTK